MLLAHIQLAVCQDPQGLFSKAAAQLVSQPQSVLLQGIISSQGKPLDLYLLKFMKYLLTHTVLWAFRD